MNKIALISVSDKTDIDLLASKLVKNGYTIISTGGTASYLQEKGINIIPISKFTKFEEILGGRVKTLHPIIHAGILAKSKKDLDKLKNKKYSLIDIVVVNLFQNDSWLINLPEHKEFKKRFGSSTPRDEYFVEMYETFVSKIRTHYPDANIICTLGSMDAVKNGSKWRDFIELAVRNMKDQKI